MRSLLIVLAAALLLATACSHNLTDVCSTGGRTGTAPHCVLNAECTGSHTGVQLDCTGTDGNCICSENGVVGKTVPYQDSFCNGGDPSDITTMEGSLDDANGACGWNL
jgi:hypothetical protein